MVVEKVLSDGKSVYKVIFKNKTPDLHVIKILELRSRTLKNGKSGFLIMSDILIKQFFVMEIDNV